MVRQRLQQLLVILAPISPATLLASGSRFCLLPEPLTRGYDATNCQAASTGTPLQASQCRIQCDAAAWYIGEASVACASGNATHPGQFELSGCQRPACPLQCGAGSTLVQGLSSSQLDALAFDRRRGFLYAADSARHVVISVDVRGAGAGSAALSTQILWGVMGSPGNSDGAATVARLRRPGGLALHADRHILFAADSGNGKVRALYPSSMSVVTVAHSLNSPGALSLYGRQDELFIAEFGTGNVRRMPLGSLSRAINGGTLGSLGVFDKPVGLAVDTERNYLYVLENGVSKAVKQVSLRTGNVEVITGGGSVSASSFVAGIDQKSASFSTPSALVLDLGAALGDAGLPTLFMADSGAKRVFAVELPRIDATRSTPRKSCQELNWHKGMESQGTRRVCGRSYANRGVVEDFCQVNAPVGVCCSGPGNWSRAKAFCELQGARLCSAFELELDEAREGYSRPTCKTGSTSYDDYYDEIHIWTSTECSKYRYGGEGGYFARAGAREWETHTPTKCVAVGDTAVYTKCCADGGLLMPVMGASPPLTSLGNGGHALYQTFTSSGPSALALDALRSRLFVAAGGAISIISWMPSQSVVAGMGYNGHTGEDVPAYYSALNRPLGLAWDPMFGKLYIADSVNWAVRSVDVAGDMTINAFAGRGKPDAPAEEGSGAEGDVAEGSDAEANTSTQVTTCSSACEARYESDRLSLQICNGTYLHQGTVYGGCQWEGPLSDCESSCDGAQYGATVGLATGGTESETDVCKFGCLQREAPAQTFPPTPAPSRLLAELDTKATASQVCEGRGFDASECASIGCCKYSIEKAACSSAVGANQCKDMDRFGCVAGHHFPYVQQGSRGACRSTSGEFNSLGKGNASSLAACLSSCTNTSGCTAVSFGPACFLETESSTVTCESAWQCWEKQSSAPFPDARQSEVFV